MLQITGFILYIIDDIKLHEKGRRRSSPLKVSFSILKHGRLSDIYGVVAFDLCELLVMISKA